MDDTTNARRRRGQVCSSLRSSSYSMGEDESKGETHYYAKKLDSPSASGQRGLGTPVPSQGILKGLDRNVAGPAKPACRCPTRKIGQRQRRNQSRLAVVHQLRRPRWRRS